MTSEKDHTLWETEISNSRTVLSVRNRDSSARNRKKFFFKIARDEGVQGVLKDHSLPVLLYTLLFL